jgi:predicted Holliday junction resolvase-like endonuclease
MTAFFSIVVLLLLVIVCGIYTLVEETRKLRRRVEAVLEQLQRRK